jgi:hypothetical protein
MIDSILLLDVLAVVLQLMASYFAYRIFKFNRLNKRWLALVLAFLVQTVRRGVQVCVDLNILSLNVFIDRVLMFIISLLMIVGLWTMMKNFENFEVVEKNVGYKLSKSKK